MSEQRAKEASEFVVLEASGNSAGQILQVFLDLEGQNRFYSS